MIKTTVGEYEKFYNDDSIWKDGIVVDDEALEIDGVEVESIYSENGATPYEKATKLIIKDGFIYHEDTGNDIGSLESIFKKWKKKQSNDRILIEIDKAKSQELLDFVKKIGGKVVK